MKASLILTVALGVASTSAATIPHTAASQSEALVARASPSPAALLPEEEIDRRSWASALNLAPYLIDAVAPVLPQVVDKVSNGIKHVGSSIKHLVTGGKNKKKGKRDEAGAAADDDAGFADSDDADFALSDYADLDFDGIFESAEAVARPFVA